MKIINKKEILMKPDALFTVFGNGVTLYGICIAVGILACIVVLYLYTKKKGVPEDVQDYVFFIAIVAIAVGFLMAKVFQAFYNWIEDGFKNFNFMSAGITVMGGLIGGAAMFLLLYFSLGKFVFKGKKAGWHKKYFNDVFLIAPICITVAHAFGRIGCLMSGCCHGKYLGREYVFGGIKMYGSVTSASGNTIHKWGYYVPTQLYESLFLFALFAVLSILYFKRCNILMSIYLIAYAVWRMFIEFFRTDARGAIVLGLAPSQWMSIIFVLMGGGLLLYYYLKKIPFFLPEDNDEKAKKKTIKDQTEDNNVSNQN